MFGPLPLRRIPPLVVQHATPLLLIEYTNNKTTRIYEENLYFIDPASAAARHGLAADMNTVYVGGVELAGSSTSIAYATTNENGEVITEGATADNYNIKWDGSTLTLHDATIKKGLAYDQNTPAGSTIHGSAIGVLNQSGYAELTVQLEGSNMIDEVSTGIYVHSSGGGAALSIAGNGTLFIDSTFCPIQVISFNGNAALSIENAKVTATSSYYNGVTVQSGNSENSSASLTVNGGSLTATAQSSGVSGIRFVFGSGGSGSGTPNLTVSGNATVRANGSAGGITNNFSTGVQYGTGGKETGGIIWNGTEGTVYGNVTLQEDLEIGEGESLTIPEGSSLNMNGHTITVEEGGKLEGTIDGNQPPEITVSPVNQTVEEDSPAAFSVTASAGEGEQLTYQWQQKTTDSGSEWMDISDATNATYTTGQTTMAMSGYQYRCVVTASDISVISAPATLTVNAKPTYTITAVVVPEGAGSVKVNDSGTSATVVESSEVTLTATANEGYRFVDWVEGDQTVSTDATYIFTATGNRTLTARFEKLYTVTVSPAEGGTATADKTTAAAGETVTLTTTPESGYYFVEWKVVPDNLSIQENQFTMPAENVEVQAVFGLSVTNITLDKTELPLYIGDSETLTATIEPGDATNKTVTWSSDKPGVAAVDASGNVTAVAAGNATITAMADGGKTATCVVQVREYVEVEASGSTNLSFTTDRDKFTLTAVVKAEGNVLTPTENSWKWSVANEDVVERVTLRSKAVSYSTSRQAFTIKGTGTTTITATYDDGTYRGLVEFKVSISKPTPPDPISYYNIYVEDVCDGVEVSTSKNVVREGGSVSVYVKKDTVNYTFDNFKVYYKRSYYGGWEELKEGTQPGEYPIKNIWTHIYIKAEGAEEKEDPTGIESIEGVKVYTKDGSLYVQTPQREQVIIVSMSGAVVKNEEQIGLKQYHGLQPGIYIVRVGDRAYKLRLN